MNETITPIDSMSALYGALAKAQGAFQPIVKNRDVEITMKTGGRYKFRYADLEEILSKTRPALSANGLALIQTISNGSLVCQLVHAGGGSISSEVPMPSARDLSDPKSFGAAITYLRRYLVTAILGVAADDDLDDDGQPAGNKAAAANDGYADYEDEHLTPMREAALQGSEALAKAFSGLPKSVHKTVFWQTHQKALKAAAAKSDAEVPA